MRKTKDDSMKKLAIVRCPCLSCVADGNLLSVISAGVYSGIVVDQIDAGFDFSFRHLTCQKIEGGLTEIRPNHVIVKGSGTLYTCHVEEYEGSSISMFSNGNKYAYTFAIDDTYYGPVDVNASDLISGYDAIDALNCAMLKMKNDGQLTPFMLRTRLNVYLDHELKLKEILAFNIIQANLRKPMRKNR